jgi:hypothetical protein
MDIKKNIVKNYQIDNITNIIEPTSGSGNAFIVITPQAKYLAK